MKRLSHLNANDSTAYPHEQSKSGHSSFPLSPRKREPARKGRRCPPLAAALFLTTSFLLASPAPARAQSVVEVSEVQVSYLFGSHVTFSARIRAAVPMQEAWLLFQSAGETNTHLVRPTLSADGRLVYQHPAATGTLRPFAPVYFWYRITLTNGEVYTSPRRSFAYIDNRFPWQILEDEWVRVHWYAGDLDFGQAAFDIAHVGLQKVSEILPYQKSPPIDLYIYASAVDLKNALALGGPAWASGQASPDLGVALVAIAPDPAAKLEMERQIPHELAHIVLYQRAGAAYERLPIWLREGIASLTEIYPNPDYRTALKAAAQNGLLLDISDLCYAFPSDAGRAYLAYAEADSFTRYLYHTYGPPALFHLVVAYADGMDCEQGARHIFGLSLTQLDRRWRQATLDSNALLAAGQHILPYLILLLIILSIPVWGWSYATARRKHEREQDI